MEKHKPAAVGDYPKLSTRRRVGSERPCFPRGNFGKAIHKSTFGRPPGDPITALNNLVMASRPGGPFCPVL